MKEKKFVVDVPYGRWVFGSRYSAMKLVEAISQSDGKTDDYSEKDIMVCDTGVDVPGIKCWRGEWISREEQEDKDNPTENAQIRQLQNELASAKSECHTTNYRKQEAEEKAEKHELEVCRLAGVLESNFLDKEGKSTLPLPENEDAKAETEAAVEEDDPDIDPNEVDQESEADSG